MDGLAMGLGFAFALMGALREIGGSGTVFSGAANLLGPAFAVLGLMIAAKRALDARKPAPSHTSASLDAPTSVAAAS